MILRDSGGVKNAPPDANFGSNAMVTDKDGSILLTRMAIGTSERMEDKGGLKPFLSKYEGKRLNSPNALVFTKDGALWFTDPSFGLPKMDADPKKEQKFNAVWRYAGGKLTPVITDMPQPTASLSRRTRGRCMCRTPCPISMCVPMMWARTASSAIRVP